MERSCASDFHENGQMFNTALINFLTSTSVKVERAISHNRVRKERERAKKREREREGGRELQSCSAAPSA